METLWLDLRYAARSLRGAPVFAALAVLTLALGIGANTAIFSVVHAVLLKPLPFPEPDRLVVMHNLRHGRSDGPSSSSLPDFEDWRAQEGVFERTGLFAYWTFNLIGREVPERVVGGRVTGDFFPTLGARPLLGRVLTREDDTPGTAETVVLSYGLWQRSFGGDAAVLGKEITLNGRPHTIVGVMPPEFHFPYEDVQVWAAVKDNMTGMRRHNRFMFVFARLQSGVSLSQAQSAIDAVSRRLQAEFPDSNKGYTVQLVTAQETLVGKTRAPLMVLLGAVGFVLLIACANVGNLLLARSVARRRDSAIRAALGASPSRLLRQFLVENGLLASLGGTLGIVVGFAGLKLLLQLHPGGIPRLDQVGLNPAVLTVTLGLTLLTGFALGVIPALQAWRTDLQVWLKEGGRGDVSGSGSGRLRDALVAAEVALALVLLIGGGLLLRSLMRLTAVDSGLEAEKVVMMSVFLTPPGYAQIPERVQYVERAIENIAAIPQVESVAAITDPPLGDSWITMSFYEEGKPVPPADAPLAGFRAMTPDYLRTAGLSLLRGRSFTADDREVTARVLLVNESMARRMWPNQDPIGKRLRWSDPQRDVGAMTIVGVVRDTKSRGLDTDEGLIVYAPVTQVTFPWMRWFTFVVRASGDPNALAAPARAAILQFDPQRPVFSIRTMQEAFDTSLAGRRFNLYLLQLFAVLAALLAGLGIFSVVSYSVTRRTREIGVRMALGAQRGQILGWVLLGGMRSVLLGVATGLLAAAGLTRYMATLLFEIEPIDAVTFAAVSAGILLVALAASLWPARRAMRVDPVIALRYE